MQDNRDQSIDFDKFFEQFQAMNQFDKHQQFHLLSVGPGKCEYSIKIAQEHLSTLTNCHGGVLSGLMDCILGVAALSKAVTLGKICSTVEFKINYLNPAYLHDELTGRGEIIFSGKSLVVSKGDIFHTQQQTIICTGMGTFNLYSPKKKFQENQIAF